MTKKDKIQLTPDGFEELKKELEHRKNVKKKELAKSLGEATAKGDLSENDEYNIILEESLANEGRISELTSIIKNAEIVSKKKCNKNITLGSEVTIQDEKKNEKIVNIVGETEADPLKQKVSNTSPMGKGLLGKSVGDIVKISTPRGTTKYVIKKIK